jgi:GntR family transcriptional regulator
MYLDVPSGAALVSITRTATDDDGNPIEHSHDLFRSDLTRLIVRSGAAAAAGNGRAEVVQLHTFAMPDEPDHCDEEEQREA